MNTSRPKCFPEFYICMPTVFWSILVGHLMDNHKEGVYQHELNNFFPKSVLASGSYIRK